MAVSASSERERERESECKVFLLSLPPFSSVLGVGAVCLSFLKSPRAGIVRVGSEKKKACAAPALLWQKERHSDDGESASERARFSSSMLP